MARTLDVIRCERPTLEITLRHVNNIPPTDLPGTSSRTSRPQSFSVAKSSGRVYRPGFAMNTEEKPRPSRGPLMSAEAIVGIGITVAELGVLCLLLGWAEHMRSVPTAAWSWLVLGAILFVLGGIAALSARPKDPRRIRAERVSSSDAQNEPEERLE